MNPLNIEKILLDGGHFLGTDYSLLEITGSDRSRYMQGQLTADLDSIKEGEATLNTRLNQSGKIVAFFYYLKGGERDYIAVDVSLASTLKKDLEKYIIMDDVEIHPCNKQVVFSFGLSSFKLSFENSYTIPLFENPGKIILLDSIGEMEFLSDDIIHNCALVTAYPIWNKTIGENEFINDSRLNELAISYKKGCFLGQETVAKINNNRGAAYYPTLLEIEVEETCLNGVFSIDGRKGGEIIDQAKIGNKIYILAKLYRDFRVNKKKVVIEFSDKKIPAVVNYAPLFGSYAGQKKAQEYYDLAIDEFQKNNESFSLELLNAAITLCPDLADAFEVIGVILGRHERYEEGIQFMDKLLAIDNSSVMAHTNKSLFLMKLGKIEEAENEKSLATVKTFEKLGKDAAAKRALEEENNKKQADIIRRESMFKQVLELDEKDVLANYGMADIFFMRGNTEEAIAHLEVVLNEDKQYSNGYLLLGKCLLAKKDSEKAKEVFEKGIAVASKRGDMIPANSMQSLLNSIV